MIGTTISHYKILEKLAEGGMGVVYKAEDAKLKRLVALKFLSPSLLASENDRRRFVHEAQASAALSHPNIATVFEIDDSTSKTFIALEFVEGQSLTEKIKSGPFKIDDALSIATQLSEGLLAAHQKGIVHRDIKSQNIMVTTGGQVKILDFGLAKLRGATVVTKAGTTVGTMGYMSPEQLKGEAVDHRTDLWAIGVVLYEMVSGRKPFQADYEDAVAYQVLNQQPEPLTAIRTGVPMELERIINKLLSKNLTERYQSATDLLVDLKTFKRVSESGLTQTVASMPGTRKRKWLVPTAGSLLLIGAFIVAYTLFIPTSRPIKTIAVMPMKSLSPRQDQDYVVEGMQNALIEELSRIGSLTVRGKNSVMRFKDSDKSTQEIASALGVDALLQGSAILDGTTIRISLQLIDGKSDNTLWAEPYDREYGHVLTLVSTIAREVATRIKSNITPEGLQGLAEKRNIDSKAYDLYQRGISLSRKSTPESTRKAHECFVEVIKIEPQFAPAYAWLGGTFLGLGTNIIPPNDTLGRRKALVEGRAAVKRALELDRNLALGHNTLGYYFLNDWDLKEAEKEFREALLLNPGDPDNQWSMVDILPFVGKYDEAIACTRKSEELDPLYWGRKTAVAWALFYAGRYQEALAKAREALELDETSVMAWTTIGHCSFILGLKREAMLAWARMHELDGNTELAKAFRELPMDAALQKYVDQSTTARGPIYNNPGVAALACEYMGKRSEAVKWLEKAYQIHDNNLLELLVNPFWAGARKDPRVLSIIKRMGLEQYVRR